MIKPILVKNGILRTIGVIFIFCCFFIWALAFHDVPKDFAQHTEKPVQSSTLQAPVSSSFSQLPATVVQSTENISTTSSLHTEHTVKRRDIAHKKKTAVEHIAIVKKPLKKELAIIPLKVATTTLVTLASNIEENKTFEQEIRQRIADATNAFRTAHKVNELAYEQTLQKNAQAYSATLLERNFFSHTDTSGCDLNCRITRDGFKAKAWGENLAVLKFSDVPTASEVATFFMREWEKSEGHRKNLLSTHFTHQGIGIAISNHAAYVTVQFANPL